MNPASHFQPAPSAHNHFTSTIPTHAPLPPFVGTEHYGHGAPQPSVFPHPSLSNIQSNERSPAVAETAPPSGAATIQELAEVLMLNRKDPLPEWKLSQFNGDPLNWHEWFGQFRSAIDSQRLSDDVKLTYLKTLVTGKAKSAIAEFAYCGAMYTDALKTLERKFGQPQTIVSAHMEKLANFPPLKMHSSDNVISFSTMISSLVGVFKSLSFHSDLKGSALLTQAIQKLPPNMKESWSRHTVKRHWERPTLLEFNDWLKQEAEAHDRVKVISFKRKEESSEKVKTSSKSFAATAEPTSTNDSSRTPEPCIVCKARHALWRCAVFREKTPTQRAKLVAENRLCFSCLNGKHTFRKCPKSRKCGKDGCKSSHNTLLHGAERVFPATDKIQKLNQSSGSSNSPKPAASAAQDTAKQTSKLTSLTDVKGLLQVKLIDVVTPSGKSARALSLCDTGGSHSWMSHSLAERLDVAGTDIRLIVNGINTQKTVDTSMVTVTIHPLGDKTCDPFELSPYLSANLNVGSDTIDVPSLQEVYPHLSVLDPVNYSYAQVEIILGQDVYHAIRPIEYFEAESKHSKHSPVAVRLPIGWVLSGPLPCTSTFASTCFKVIFS